MLGFHPIVFHSSYENYFLKAQAVRSMVRRDFDNVFRVPNVRRRAGNAIEDSSQSANHGVDILLHPSAIRTAPTLAEARSSSTKREGYVQDILTVPASLAQLPALSLPCGLGIDGWPIGLSMIGQWGTDALLLDVANMIENLLNIRTAN